MSERTLVIQTAFPGDSVLTIPMLKYLKSRSPEVDLDVVCAPGSASIFASLEEIRKVWIFEKRGSQKSIFSIFDFAAKLRKEKYAKIYSAHRSFRSALLTFLCRPDESYGFSNASAKYFYRSIIEYRKDFHEVRRNLFLAGMDKEDHDWKIQPTIKPGEKDKASVVFLLKTLEAEKKYVILAPGSVWETKIYPLKYYIEIANSLVGKGYNVLISGGESDELLCREIADRAGSGVFDISGQLTLTESVALYSGASLIISNDSAPAHLAMAAGAPVLMIYCSTVPDFGFYPYMENSRYISLDGLKCKPCGIHGHHKCPEQHFNCGNNLKPQTIIKMIDEILEAEHSKS